MILIENSNIIDYPLLYSVIIIFSYNYIFIYKMSSIEPTRQGKPRQPPVLVPVVPFVQPIRMGPPIIPPGRIVRAPANAPAPARIQPAAPRRAPGRARRF